jgi:hypothetical protein
MNPHTPPTANAVIKLLCNPRRNPQASYSVGKSSNNAYVTDAAIPSHGNATNNFATEAPGVIPKPESNA